MAGAAGGGKEKAVKPLGWVWFSGLMLGMTACLPYIIEYMCSKSYATHRHGVVLVTGATSAVGKAACLALLADGYTVRTCLKGGWRRGRLESRKTQILGGSTGNARWRRDGGG